MVWSLVAAWVAWRWKDRLYQPILKKAMSILIKSDRWNTNHAKIHENKIGEKHKWKRKNLTLASMSSNSTMLPALGVTMADWTGKSCIEGIFSLARDVTTRGLISSFSGKQKTLRDTSIILAKLWFKKNWKLMLFLRPSLCRCLSGPEFKDNKELNILDHTLPHCERSFPPSLTMGEKPL